MFTPLPVLFAYPDKVSRPCSEEGVHESTSRAWSDLADSLRERPMREPGGKPTPHVVEMTPEARREWAKWCQEHRDEQEADDFPAGLEGSWGKFEAYAARLALILHLMDLASDPTQANPSELPRRIITSAARLVAYFKGHLRRIRASKNGTGGDDVRALLGWMIRNQMHEFSHRDIDRNFDRFKQDPAALSDALSWMIRQNLIRPIPEPKGEKPKSGRKASPRYQANPDIQEDPRFRQFRQNGRTGNGNVGNVGNVEPVEGME